MTFFASSRARSSAAMTMRRSSSGIRSNFCRVVSVGSDATRFMLLYRRNDAAMDFDFAVVKELES